MNCDPIQLTPPFAEIIPEPDPIRARLKRTETEAALLRRLLRLSLRRRWEASRLNDKETDSYGP